jgi:hypothetical protein
MSAFPDLRVETEELIIAGDRVDLIRFSGHLPKGGYDVQTDGRHSQAAAPPPTVRC